MFTARATTCYFGYREICVLEAIYIDGGDDITIRAIADLLGLKASVVTTTVNTLVVKGYIKCVADGFPRHYQLTDKGAKIAPQSSRIKKLFPPEFATAKNVAGKTVVLLHHRTDRMVGHTTSTWRT